MVKVRLYLHRQCCSLLSHTCVVIIFPPAFPSPLTLSRQTVKVFYLNACRLSYFMTSLEALHNEDYTTIFSFRADPQRSSRVRYPPKWCNSVLFGCYMAGATRNCCRLGARSVYSILMMMWGLMSSDVGLTY